MNYLAINIFNNKNFVTKYLSKFDWDKIIVTFTNKIISIILLSIFFLVVTKIGQRIIKKFFYSHEKKSKTKVSAKRNKTLFTLTSNSFSYLIIFFWIYSILSTVGVPVGTLVAGAGVFSLALGLGAQGFVSDIVSGFFILSERQLDVGERVTINNISGFVTSVGLRTTQITSVDGTLNFIPNRNISIISNLSRGDMLATIDIRIFPDTPINKLEEIIKNVNNKLIPDDENVIDDPILFGTLNAPNNSLVYEVFIRTKNETQFDTQNKYLAAYLTEISNNGIELPSMEFINTK
ncbi:mechanosensitive ion channel [Lactobacillus sp. S2-2]|uniref:mechanosensitive ion channel family protein n=1 Tax=Lactobacillus sp. S2-2 TaxID=2692917 RepID=UPI001F40E5C8|nr:mechanosensitive ion channel domain-containing protein [Lactobacillus sp. S2-2]MCF6515822.1 mechanosensitive ion channel [Lactobacillus sp. S2-2]